MDFSAVENARIAYRQKSKKAWRIAFLVIGGIQIIMCILPIISSVRFGSLNGKDFVMMLLEVVFSTLLFGSLGGLVISSMTTSKEREAYRKEYKRFFVAQVMAMSFKDVFYNHAYGLPSAKLYSTGMINIGDRYTSNDYTKGKYKNVGLEQADVHIQEIESTDDGVEYRTIFMGRFMFFEFPKKFNFKVMLVGPGAGAVMIPRVGKKGCDFKKMETESNEFNRKFKIFAEDGFEMFYLLDPVMMTNLMDIYDKYKGRVMFGFVGNQLFIGVNDGRDYFEPPSASKPIDAKKELEKNLNEVRLITSFVDKLNLDHKNFQG